MNESKLKAFEEQRLSLDEHGTASISRSERRLVGRLVRVVFGSAIFLGCGGEPSATGDPLLGTWRTTDPSACASTVAILRGCFVSVTFNSEGNYEATITKLNSPSSPFSAGCTVTVDLRGTWTNATPLARSGTIQGIRGPGSERRSGCTNASDNYAGSTGSGVGFSFLYSIADGRNTMTFTERSAVYTR